MHGRHNGLARQGPLLARHDHALAYGRRDALGNVLRSKGHDKADEPYCYKRYALTDQEIPQADIVRTVEHHHDSDGQRTGARQGYHQVQCILAADDGPPCASNRTVARSLRPAPGRPPFSRLPNDRAVLLAYIKICRTVWREFRREAKPHRSRRACGGWRRDRAPHGTTTHAV